MRIHFLTSAHNSLSQRLLVELTERGHKVPWRSPQAKRQW
jgi:putative two-component system protein, hydrogenase maturation factor HypX/HoxX